MTTNRYVINGLLKFAEEDNFKNGCNPDTSTSFMVDVDFSAGTIEAVIKKAADFLGCDNDGIEKNACDEAGRVDFAVMEDDNSQKPSRSQIAAWKKGDCRLWYVVYTAHVEKVTRVQIPA